MALSAVLTKDMTVLQGANVIAFATDYNLEINKEPVDVTNLGSAGWKQYLVDLKEWKVSFTGLVTRGTTVGSQVGYEQLMTSLLGTDTTLTCALKSTSAGDQYVSGQAYLVSLKQSGQVGDRISYTGEFQGTGTLATATV